MRYSAYTHEGKNVQDEYRGVYDHCKKRIARSGDFGARDYLESQIRE